MKQASMETTGTLGELGAGAPERNAKPTSPVLYVGLAVALGLGAVMIFHDKPAPSLVSRMPEAPELLAARAPCRDQGAAALARGAESEQAAIAKAERHAFDAHDGVDAAQLYGVAASCYAKGADAASAQRASAAEATWRERTIAEYQSHRLRLRLALDRGATDEAYRQARALRALFKTQTGPYVEWLAAIERAYKPVEKKRGGMGSKKRTRS